MSELRIRVPKRSRTEDTETKFTVPPSKLRNKALKYFIDIFCKNGSVTTSKLGKTGSDLIKVYLYGDYAVKVFYNDELFEHEIEHINELRDINCIVNFEILGKNTIVMEQWHGDVMKLKETYYLYTFISVFYDCITFLIKALNVLNKKDLFYTDIKLENIFYRYNQVSKTFSFCLGDIGSICTKDDKKCAVTSSVKRDIYSKKLDKTRYRYDWNKVRTERFMILCVAEIVSLFEIDVSKYYEMKGKNYVPVELPEIMQKALAQNDEYEYTLEKLQRQWQKWLKSPVSSSPNSTVSSLAKLRF